MQVKNEKELIQILIPIFYDEFTVYESNERVAFKNFSENKRYIITLHKNSRHASGEFLKAWRLFWILIIYGILRGSLFSSSVVLRENHGFVLRQRCKGR